MLTLEEAAQGFAAVASESRLDVLMTLVRAGHDGLTVGDIQNCVGIPASTLAHHLKFLAAGGLIEQDRAGRTVINRAAYERIEKLADFLMRECCADAKPPRNALRAGSVR